MRIDYETVSGTAIQFPLPNWVKVNFAETEDLVRRYNMVFISECAHERTRVCHNITSRINELTFRKQVFGWYQRKRVGYETYSNNISDPCILCNSVAYNHQMSQMVNVCLLTLLL